MSQTLQKSRKIYPLSPNLWFFVGLILQISCHSHSNEDQKILKQAAEVHQRIIEQEQNTKKVFAELAKLAEKLPPDSPIQDSLPVLQKDLEAWEKIVVEVPGFEDSGDHDHSHNHSHQAALEVSAEEMLKIQIYVEQELIVISKRLNKLLKQAKTEAELPQR